MRNLYLRFVFILVFCAFQAQSQNLEDSIYKSLDDFVTSPSEEHLDQFKLEINGFSQKNLKSGEKLAMVIAQCNMGYYSKKYNRTQEAISLYEKAWLLYQEDNFDNYDITEYCLKPLGNLYTKTGNFTQAENVIKTYINQAINDKNKDQEIAGIINLSVVYHNTGHFKMAIDILEDKLKKVDLKPEQKEALKNNLTTNLIALKDYEKAKKLVSNSSEVERSFNYYKNEALLHLKNNEISEAKDKMKLAEEILIKKSDINARDLAKFYTEKADIYLFNKEYDKAEKSFLKALKMLLPQQESKIFPDRDILYPENTFLTIFDGLAKLQDDWEKALQYYDLSFYVSDLINHEITSQQAKILHLSSSKKRTEACLDILYEQSQNSNDNSIFKRALNYVENNKAIVLKENIKKRAISEAQPQDYILSKSLELKRLQQSLINRVIRSQLNNENPSDSVLKALNKINLAYNQTQELIDKDLKQTTNHQISIEEIQKKLELDKAEMQLYFFGQKSVYDFIITEKTTAFNKTGNAKDLRILIKEYLSFFEDPSVINSQLKDFKESAHQLYRKLNLEQLHSKNIIIIPDALLSFTPFDSFLTEKSKTSQFEKMPFLIREKSLTYQTSISFYLDDRKESNLKNQLGVFPVFENTSYELSYSKDEAKSFGKLENSDILYQNKATKSEFLKKASHYNILHLSTHAQGGNFSIPASLAFYDETLILPELYTLDLNPELVVLSACETGIGKIQGSEGAMSLARGFQYAGAKNLLFSLWQVNDQSTAEMMTSFYNHFENHQSKSYALHQSKLDYLDYFEIRNHKKSPYYWAGFVYYGELETPQETDSPQIKWWIIFIILGAILCVFLLLRKRKHNSY